MKKNIFVVLLILSLLLAGCSQASISKDIWEKEWIIESVTDLDGKLLKDRIKKDDVSLNFLDKDNFYLLDNINDEEYKGSYVMEKVDSSYKLDLKSRDGNEKILGTYGVRKYNDNKKALTIILETKDKIYTFIEDK